MSSYDALNHDELKRIAHALERIATIMAIRTRGEMQSHPDVQRMMGMADGEEVIAALKPRPRR